MSHTPSNPTQHNTTQHHTKETETQNSEYAYDCKDFAIFYDLLVASLPPEFEAGEDVRYFASVVRKCAHDTSMSSVRVLDMCGGTARVTLVCDWEGCVCGWLCVYMDG